MANSTSTDKTTRWQQIEQIWKDYILEYGVLAIVFFIVLGFWVFGDNLFDMLDNRLGYVTNVFTELLSIVITVFVLDRLNARRQDKQELTRLKALLGSNESVVTKIAVAELKAKGWLEDGSLKGANLANANLAGARLYNANLEGADLPFANLESTKLWFANLENVNLESAKLNGANLWNTNLQGVSLSNAELEGADLSGVNLQDGCLQATNFKNTSLQNTNLQYALLDRVNLQGASLVDANLQGAILWSVICDERTILPNGEYWTEDVDWSKFGTVKTTFMISV
ncbi:MAG: hypothetical protein Phog2KO_31460 [Phototrophicaceae bacterium]